MSRQERLKWAIVGVGIAGRARARAIAADPRSSLVAVWRGRFAAETGAPSVADLDAAIASADAVAICSPTSAHPEHVRAVLEAGRHCIVEFPLAPDAATAQALLELARERDRVLHVEHIELLDAPCQTLCAHLKPEIVQDIEIVFERPGPEDIDGAALATGNVARLHRVTAVGGRVRSVDSVAVDRGRLTAELTLATGTTVSCRFQQAPYFARRTWMKVVTPAGTWEQDDDVLLRDGTPQTLLGLGSLFLRDQRAATARILDGVAPYVSDARILHVLDVAAHLGRGELGPVPQR